MKDYFADFHIHVGCSEEGQWVKIPTSRNLTPRNIFAEAADKKGLDIIGIIDALSPVVQKDLKKMVAEGLLVKSYGGGYSYDNKVIGLLGGEIETVEDNGGISHTLLFFPDLDTIEKFSNYMNKHIRNINLSCQNAHMSLKTLIEIASSFEAIIIPAHVFTPHKSLYGSCANRMSHILNDFAKSKINAIEVGLSADSSMADRISELAEYTLVSNSDAHSLHKIAREYNSVFLKEPTFEECIMAFARKGGRRVSKNYGLNPKLGKYHATHCKSCYADNVPLIEAKYCAFCKSSKITKGVFDRIEELADYTLPHHPSHRPPYIHQIPLEYIPGIGPKTLKKLLNYFDSEMNVLHYVPYETIATVIGEPLAREIVKARSGEIIIQRGSGGVYGRIIKPK